jgi:multidrug resistance efflux pump
MAANIQHVVPSQRRHYRVTVPVSIYIDGIDHSTLNWSVSGFKISGTRGRFSAGETRAVYIKIPFQSFDVGFISQARIRRVDNQAHEMAGEFIDMDPRRRETLALFIQGLVRGEMAPIGGVIKKLDQPVTPASLHPVTTSLTASEMEHKRRFGMRAYGIAGSLLALVLLVVLYTNFFQLKVTTSAVMGRNDVIISPAAGDITYMAELNKPLKPGEPMVTLVDQRLQNDIQDADFRLRDAGVETHRLETMLDLDKKRMSAASGIVTEELSAASDTVKALRSSLEVKRRALQRLQALDKEGYVTKTTLDKAQGDYFDTERELHMARQEEAKRRQEVSTVKAGFQVRDEAVQTGVFDSEAMYNAALERMKNTRAELETLKGRQERLSVKAPTTGHLVRIFTPQYSSAKYGDPVAVFERDGSRVIQAFLTQQEALKISRGDLAKAYFSSHFWSVPMKVVDIDFYSLTLGQSRGLFQWQNIQNDQFKTVAVTLEPADDEANRTLQKIESGTASTLVFNLI